MNKPWDMTQTDFDKEREYIVRDILNPRLKQVELVRNVFVFDMDLRAYIGDTEVGYVEVEVAQRSWPPDVPHWSSLSFLWRKVFNSMAEKCFFDTIYCKVKKDYTDAFATSMEDIVYHGIWSDRNGKNLNLDPRLDNYVEVPKKSPVLVYGLDDVSKYIDNFFTNKMSDR